MKKDLEVAKQALSANDLPAAHRLLRKCLRAVPRDPQANELFAYVLGRMGRVDQAVRHLEIATSTGSASDTAWYYLGVGYFGRHDLPRAERAFRAAVSVNPRFFEASHDLGRTLHEQGRHAEAVEALEKAASLGPASPEALHNLGRSLSALGRYADALDAYDRALALNPARPETWLNRGEALHDLGRFSDALESYARARQLRRHYPEATSNEAITLLKLGRLEAGFEAFEARWEGTAALTRRHMDIARWHGGTSLSGKRLLVWSEQGLGDAVQFSRYIPLLEQQGAHVVFEVHPDIEPVMQRSFGCEVIALGEDPGPIDLQVSVLSLPHAFHTREESIPRTVPYLACDDTWAARWSGRLARRDGRPSVALACSGRATYKYEQRRRVPLSMFASLARHCTLFLAQRDLHEDDRRVLESGAVQVEWLGSEMHDLRDAFGIVKCVDLVISVDTSLTHVAGSLGQHTCLLLADVADWRWIAGRDESPWYPSVRIFHQSVPGSWHEPLARVEDAVRELAAADCPPEPGRAIISP